MHKFLSFKTMLTPVLIQVFFWLGLTLCLVASIVQFIKLQIWAAVIVLVLGPLVLRIVCEATILFFRMNATLNEIEQGIKKIGDRND